MLDLQVSQLMVEKFQHLAVVLHTQATPPGGAVPATATGGTAHSLPRGMVHQARFLHTPPSSPPSPWAALVQSATVVQN